MVRVVPPSVPKARSIAATQDPSDQDTTLRTLAALLVERQAFSQALGLTFYDQTTGQFLRNLYGSLGYARAGSLTYKDFYNRYERGGIAERIVDAYPQATWSGGARVVEDPDPSTETEFEAAVRELFNRLQVWSKLTRADTLSGIGRYSVLLIGAPGTFTSPLPTDLTSDNIAYLTPLPESRANIESYVTTDTDPRYNLPEYYNLDLGDSKRPNKKKVHHSRIIHIADGLLDNDLFGKPRLRGVWNYLDDLDKIVGGGAEAAWKRMDPGMQVDVDPTMPFSQAEQDALSDELDEHQHGLRRYIRTRGTKVNLLTTTVAGFGPNADAVIKLISATTGIPHRILTGSERGELASSQDRLNWSDRITERRRSFATPLVRDLISRFIDCNVLPAPQEVNAVRKGKGAVPVSEGGSNYTIMWPEVGEIDNVTKADVIGKLAAANQAQYISGGEPIITGSEVRRLFLGLGPMDPGDIPPTKSEVELEKLKLKSKDKSGQGTNDNVGSGATDTGPEPDTPSPSGEGGPDA